MEKTRSGFVYIWYDRKHKRFYIGCHWGKEDGRYICSSTWMRRSYKRRPFDFKRRILSRVDTNRKDLLEEEYKWLLMIKDEELGRRYYNLSKKYFGHWSTDESKRLLIIEKCRIGNIGKKHTEEAKQKVSKALKGRPSPMKGRKQTEEAKQKVSKALQGKKKVTRTEEHKQNLGLALKGRTPWNTGLSKSTDDRVMKQAASLIGHLNHNKDCINQYSGLSLEMQERPPQCKTYIVSYVDGRIEMVERLSVYSKNNNIPRRTLEVGIQKGYGPMKHNIASIKVS